MYLAYKDTNILFKILPCILIAIFIVMLLTSVCYAESDTNSFVYHSEKLNKDITVKLPQDSENYPYRLVQEIYTEVDNGYTYFVYIFCSNKEFYALEDGKSITTEGVVYRPNFYKYPSTKFNYTIDLSSDSIYSSYNPSTSPYVMVLSNVLYSNANINDVNGNQVFLPAPQEGELVKVTKSISFLEVFQEILGILPIILLIVIGLLGLRKAINLIFQMLRKV